MGCFTLIASYSFSLAKNDYIDVLMVYLNADVGFIVLLFLLDITRVLKCFNHVNDFFFCPSLSVKHNLSCSTVTYQSQDPYVLHA